MRVWIWKGAVAAACFATLAVCVATAHGAERLGGTSLTSAHMKELFCVAALF